MLDKIRKFFTLEEDDDDYYYEEQETHASLATVDDKREKGKPVIELDRPRKSGNLLSLVPSKKPCVLVLEPTSYAEAIKIAEQLKLKRPVLLNMAKSDVELARRIIDFLYGINYAQDGHMVNVAEQIYLFTPSSIEIRFPGRKDGGRKENFPV